MFQAFVFVHLSFRFSGVLVCNLLAGLPLTTPVSGLVSVHLTVHVFRWNSRVQPVRRSSSDNTCFWCSCARTCPFRWFSGVRVLNLLAGLFLELPLLGVPVRILVPAGLPMEFVCAHLFAGLLLVFVCAAAPAPCAWTYCAFGDHARCLEQTRGACVESRSARATWMLRKPRCAK